MTPKDYIISIVIFTILILGVVEITDSFIANDNKFVPTTGDNQTYAFFKQYSSNKDTLNSSINELQQSITTTEESSIGDFVNILFNKGYRILTLMFGTFTWFTTALGSFATLFNGVIYIPSWAVALLISIITISILFAIVSAILNRDL